MSACLMGFTALPAMGQTIITGKVTDAFGAGLQSATVNIVSLRLGTMTNASGEYTLTVPDAGARGQSVDVTVRYLGYTPLTQSVTLTPGTHTLNFSLKADPFHLGAVVTTGVADSTSQRSLTFSVAKVTGEQIAAVPAANPLENLSGQVAGLKVDVGTGNPGSDPAIRIRGSTCLTVGCSSPLIIIDGVITTESIADIDAQDISSIEILKGAAGASFYGSNAANGVINITTKRGRDLVENHLTITAHTEYGNSDIAHYPGVNAGTRNQFNPDGSIQLTGTGAAVLNTSGFDDTPYPSSGINRFRNQLKQWTSNNDYYNNDVTVGLRRGNTNFNTSYSSDHNGGILPFKNGQFRQNVRLNVDQGIGDKADLSASITYGNQHNDYGPNSSTAWFNLYQASPIIDLAHPYGTAANPQPGFSAGDSSIYFPVLPTWSDVNARGNPLFDLHSASDDFNRQRMLGSLAARYHPTDWLRLDANYGTDRLNATEQYYQARGTPNNANGSVTLGNLREYTNNDVSWNSQLRATATKLWRSLLSTTSVAYQTENSSHTGFNAGGNQLSVYATPTLGAVNTTALSVGSYNDLSRTIDYMVSQDFDLKDRYIVSALYRRDGSSLFGADARWSNFYRISGAYRVTQDIHIPGVQELKLHVAQGTAGLRPGYTDQYETYNFSGVSLTKANVGNKLLKPAVLTETEYGLNIDFLNRFSGELTYAHRVTDGAFLNVQLSQAASGGYSNQWQNAANILSNTLEGALQTRLLDRRDFTWDLSLTGDHTTQEITWLNGAPITVNAGGQGQGIFYYKAGEPLGIIYGTRFATTIQQAITNHNTNFPSTNPSDYVVNPMGFVVLAANRGTQNERPIPIVDANGNDTFVIGNVNPKLNYGFQNDIRFNRFSIHANFDGQLGGDIYNFSKQWSTQDLRNPDMNMVGKPDAQKIAENFFTIGLYNGLDPASYYVESGAYLKLRELSVGYDVPLSVLPRIGLGRASGLRLSFVGRNLVTWTKYSGFDPDVTSGSDFNFKIDGFRYPPFRTLTGQVEIRF
ncbi:MAG TPA: SusC/RagA family TonB-linked outer membrane protein [Gemmatimonadaceae bacterium]